MEITRTELPGVYLITPRVFGDSRGWFMESWSEPALEEAGLHYTFVQDNHSYSAQKGILRGLHMQLEPYAQAKLVRCCRGAILDAAVDIRKGSPTYRKWVAAELSAENKRQLLIPCGFLHGFLTLTDDVEVLYKADNAYAPQADRSVRWNDPAIGVEWGIAAPILSAKDAAAPFLCDSDANFIYGGNI